MCVCVCVCVCVIYVVLQQKHNIAKQLFSKKKIGVVTVTESRGK